MPLQVTINYSSGTFGQATQIEFVITDMNGGLLDNLDIYMSYTEIVTLWSDSTSTVLGRGYIDFIAPNVGNLLIYYSVTDINGNYIAVEDDMNITIIKSDPSISYQLTDDQGLIYLIIDARDESNVQLSEGFVTIERFDGTWILDKTIDLSISDSTQIIMYSDTMLFRLSYIENTHYNPVSLLFNIYRQDIDFSHQVFDMKVEDGLPMYIDLPGNSSLDGFEL